MLLVLGLEVTDGIWALQYSVGDVVDSILQNVCAMQNFRDQGMVRLRVQGDEGASLCSVERLRESKFQGAGNGVFECSGSSASSDPQLMSVLVW